LQQNSLGPSSIEQHDIIIPSKNVCDCCCCHTVGHCCLTICDAHNADDWKPESGTQRWWVVLVVTSGASGSEEER